MRRLRATLCLALAFFARTTTPLQATTFLLDSDVVGSLTYYVVEKEDTLYDIARKHDLGIVEVLAANPGIDPWIPSPNTMLNLPTMHILPPVERKGVVINLPELRLYYYPDDGTVMTFPLGIGSEGWQTPVMQTKVVNKRKDPAWIPPPSIRKENPGLPAYFPPGPDNPLGAYALDLAYGSYRIHGTNKPYGIGWRSSHGCIRLYPEDIEQLFHQIAVGTPVTIIDARAKIGWQDSALWLEISPAQQQADVIADYGEPGPLDIPGIHQDIEDAAQGADIDWYAVEKAITQANGIPVTIAHEQAF